MRSALRTRTRCRATAGHSLPEAIFAVSLVGLMLVSLYTGFSSGFAVLRAARENLRATEILNRHTERLRLYTWNQLLDPQNFLRPTFVETSEPNALTADSTGVVYAGTVELSTPMDWPAAYRDRMRLVTISLTWTNLNGNTPVVSQRQVQTCVARYGMQSYVIGP
jgi:hypothetical protein